MTTAEARRKPDRRRVRHEATRQEILAVAWRMVRETGLASLSLRALAREVGMEPQSLYTYFPSKHAVYDAMFSQGNAELLRRLREISWPGERHDVVRTLMALMLQFDVEDAARSQLLFDRVIPGFEPSQGSYALAVEAFEVCWRELDRVGLGDQVSIDLLTSVSSGLATQQRANDPGGDRYVRLLDEAVEMYLAHVDRRRS